MFPLQFHWRCDFCIWSYSRTLKYCRITTLLKICGPQIWLCLFMFRPIVLKQLNSLNSIDMFSSLGGLEVTHQIAVPEVPLRYQALTRIFLLLFWFVGIVFLHFVFKNHYFKLKKGNTPGSIAIITPQWWITGQHWTHALNTRCSKLNWEKGKPAGNITCMGK